ncbi:uncharacterized protein LOC126900209 [Daktulosphaira vitifoliae]|uniref:uncharacterized protein LOC126900209 n=1 Tax=Daktulosphaira vitifoliae TaxID=58002 RepID=UPI0021A9E90F|nr:uncharacterized protein LOC126900209 [Daktulosphaira vitifoliae]
MTEDLSRDEVSRQRQERWERHMHGLCILDNHLNVEMELASHRSAVLNHLVEQANRVKDLWQEFQRQSDNGCVLEDTAVQMAIEQHGLQSHNFHQPQNKTTETQSNNKLPDIDCEDIFNQAVSAAIISNGLITSQNNSYL